MLCIFHWGRSRSLYVTGPMISSILEGPLHNGLIFVNVWPLLRCHTSNHTKSPLLNGGEIFFDWLIWACHASSYVAWASSLIFKGFASLISMVGTFHLGNAIRIPVGSYPNMRKNEVCFVIEWVLLLYENSAIERFLSHFSGFFLQNILRYVLSSLLADSVSSSVWEWYVVLILCLTLQIFIRLM